MDNLDQKNNNNGPVSGDIEPVNIDTTREGYTLQIEHENYAENAQKNIVTNEKSQSDIESLVTGQMRDPSSYPIGQEINKIEKIGDISNKNMSINFDNKIYKNELDDIDSASVVQSVGHLLRRARMARGMSIEDVSRQLRLSAQQIGAIEKEDFEKLPGRTFLRGFIRNYANLVQLDPIPLLQLLPESIPVISTYERTPFKNRQISFSSNREGLGNNQLIIPIILFIIILGAYFIFENDSWNKDSDKSYGNNEAEVKSETASVEIQLPLSSNARSEVDSQVSKSSETRKVESNTKTETVQIENKTIVKETANPASASINAGILHFKFIADSWLKVIDGTGAVLFEQVKKGGTEQVVTGKRPLSIVIGNASAVNLTYNNTAINILSYKKPDGIARFTLE